MKEALKLALEALEMFCEHGAILRPIETRDAIKEALAESEQMHIEKNMTLACPSYLHDYTTPPQQEPRNFCPRCGKRTADLTVIHTCTPPRGLENT